MLSFVMLVIGFVLLVWGADKFVEGASALARKMGVSPLLVGLTIVAFGTSMPELAVSVTAAGVSSCWAIGGTGSAFSASKRMRSWAACLSMSHTFCSPSSQMM